MDTNGPFAAPGEMQDPGFALPDNAVTADSSPLERTTPAAPPTPGPEAGSDGFLETARQYMEREGHLPERQKGAVSPFNHSLFAATNSIDMVHEALESGSKLDELLKIPQFAPIVARFSGEQARTALERLKQNDPVFHADPERRQVIAEMVDEISETHIERELGRLEDGDLGRPLTKEEMGGTMELIQLSPSLSVKRAYALSKRLDKGYRRAR